MDGPLAMIAALIGGTLLGAGVTCLIGMNIWLTRRTRHATELAEARTAGAALQSQLDERSQALDATRAEMEAIRREREEAEQRLAGQSERVLALEQAEERLKNEFLATGAQALETNSKQFLQLAQKTFDHVMTQARGDVDKRRDDIEAMVKPIRALLEKQGAAVNEIERKRDVAYRGLEEQIKTMLASSEKLDRETSRLVTALRRPEQRGRWGEMQLRNAVEMAGMSRHCDFHEQPATDDPNTRDRPDMTVRMPGESVIVVDSKVALDAYLDALEPDSDRDDQLRRHAEQIDRHYRNLARKRYWEQFERTPKLVVMFVPLESALVAAMEIKPDLHAEAMRRNVLIATPTLLVALLRAIAYGWQQDAIAENAHQIAKAGSELYDRVSKFVSHFEEVGRRLGRATESYNSAIGSLETRVLPSTRRLKQLDATTKPEVGRPPAIEVEVRPLRGEVGDDSAAQTLPDLVGEARDATNAENEATPRPSRRTRAHSTESSTS